MRVVRDPIHGEVLVPDWMADMVECEQKNRGFGIDEADRRAFSRIHDASPPSANVKVVGAPMAKTVGATTTKGTGWQDAVPLSSPSGVDICDRLMDAQDARDKQQRIAEAFVKREKKG